MRGTTKRRPSDERTSIPVSIPTPLRELIQRAAERDNRTLSAFVRLAAVEKANRILGIETQAEKDAAKAA